ncbi:MAG: VOC family protein, partial [Beijerinckiaceae bacterium]
TSEIESAMALTGFFGGALLVQNSRDTESVLERIFGFQRLQSDKESVRLAVASGAPGAHIDLVTANGKQRGTSGAGSVHHVAFRAATDDAQALMAKHLAETFNIAATEQRDRNYFRSVYFREPSGVLFEIATDDPGFAVDEPLETLGQALKLPKQYEAFRSQIEQVLPPLN